MMKYIIKNYFIKVRIIQYLITASKEWQEIKPRQFIEIKDRNQLQEGMILQDQAGYMRQIMMVQSNGNFWLSHKNSYILGYEHKFEDLRKNKIVPENFHHLFQERAQKFPLKKILYGKYN